MEKRIERVESNQIESTNQRFWKKWNRRHGAHWLSAPRSQSSTRLPQRAPLPHCPTAPLPHCPTAQWSDLSGQHQKCQKTNETLASSATDPLSTSTYADFSFCFGHFLPHPKATSRQCTQQMSSRAPLSHLDFLVRSR